MSRGCSRSRGSCPRAPQCASWQTMQPSAPSRILLMSAFTCALATSCADDCPRLLVIGDSLTARSAPQVERSLTEAGWEVRIDARPGWSIQGYQGERWRPILEKHVRSFDPDLVMIELGTNTCSGCDLAGEIDALVSVTGGREIRWLNVRDPAPLPDDPTRTNEALAAAALRQPRLTIVDMDQVFDAQPAWIGADNVHTSADGAKGLARLLASSAGEPPNGRFFKTRCASASPDPRGVRGRPRDFKNGNALNSLSGRRPPPASPAPCAGRRLAERRILRSS